MIDLLMIGFAFVVAGWMTIPPRGTHRLWLLAGFLVLWGTLVGIGWRKGVQAGFMPWLIVLSLIGALIGLIVVWSLTNLAESRKSGE